MRVLLIEDDLDVGNSIVTTLRGEVRQIVWVRQLQQADATLGSAPFDVIVLDVGLPDGDGLAWLASARTAGMDQPVLVLSARYGLKNVLRGFDRGADDYLVKPFALDELLVRLRALGRRSRTLRPERLTHEGLTYDIAAMEVRVHDRPVPLSRTESLLLEVLLKRMGKVVTRSELEAIALGTDSNSLDVHMSNLRRKLGTRLIRTVRGVGYVIDDVEQHERA